MSRLDVVVSVGLLLLAVSLLVPRVQKIRYTSDRSVSQNNMKQIVLGIHNYASAYNDRFPGVTDGGVFFEILPYVEQDNLYRQFEIHHGRFVSNPQSPTVLGPGAAVHYYISPADPTGVMGSLPAGTQADASLQGRASYYPNPDTFSTLDEDVRLPKSFPDGTANTILVAERPMNCGGSFNPWFRIGDSDDNGTNLLTRFQTRWSEPGTFATPPIASNYGIRTAGGCNPDSPATPHVGGIIVGLADGNVRNVSPTIAAGNWQAACSPAGKEAFTSDW
jgi:hypothetical protein